MIEERSRLRCPNGVHVAITEGQVRVMLRSEESLGKGGSKSCLILTPKRFCGVY